MQDEPGGAAQGDGSQFRAQPFLKAQAGLGTQVQVGRGAAVIQAVERRRFQQHIGGSRRNFAVGAAHHPADANGLNRVGNQQVVAGQCAFHAVQGGELFAGGGATHYYMAVGNGVQVKSVEGLVKLQHHIVGNIHYIVDGAQAGAGKAVLQPVRRRANFDAGDDRGGVARAEVRVGYSNLGEGVHRGAGFGIADVRHAHGLAGDGADFPGDAEDGQAVAPVGGKFQLQKSVAQRFLQGRANRRVVGQDDDALVLVADFQLGFRADHPRGHDAANARGFQLLAAPGVHIAQGGAGAGKADFLAGGHIGRAADHFQRRAVAGVNLAKGQRISVGMGPGRADIADDAALPTAAGDNFANFNAGHREPVSQLSGRQGQVNVFGKPREWDAHKPDQRVVTVKTRGFMKRKSPLHHSAGFRGRR